MERIVTPRRPQYSRNISQTIYFNPNHTPQHLVLVQARHQLPQCHPWCVSAHNMSVSATLLGSHLSCSTSNPKIWGSAWYNGFANLSEQTFQVPYHHLWRLPYVLSCFTNHTHGCSRCKSSWAAVTPVNSKVRLLSSAMTLGAQRILFERIRRSGYCQSGGHLFLSFLRFFETSLLSELPAFRNCPPASNRAAILIQNPSSWPRSRTSYIYNTACGTPDISSASNRVSTLYGLSEGRWPRRRGGCKAHNVH